MLEGASLAGILSLVFGPPILIFFSVMALKIYLRITADEEALNEVRSTMQARRSRHILGLENPSGPLSIANSDSIVDLEVLAQNQVRMTREERIKDCLNHFTVPDNSSAFIRFANSSVEEISEIESSAQFSSVRFDMTSLPAENTTNNDTTDNGTPSRGPQGPASVRSLQTAKSAKSTKSSATGKSKDSQKSKRSRASTKSRSSTKSGGARESGVSRMSARRSIDSFVRLIKPRNRKNGDVCIVCMDGYRHGDVVCKTKCSHVFHKECVEEWMKKHNRCPLCKSDLFLFNRATGLNSAR